MLSHWVDIVIQVLAETLAVKLTKAECLVETLSDAITDAPACTVANELEVREAEAFINTFVVLLEKRERKKTFSDTTSDTQT